MAQRNERLIWELPRPGSTYVIGVDTASGQCQDGSRQSDPTVVEVLRVMPPEKGEKHYRAAQVAELRADWDEQESADECVKLANFYNKAFMVIESNIFGIPVNRNVFKQYTNIYSRRHLDAKTQQMQHRLGFFTGPSTRPVLMSDIRVAFKRDWLFVVSRGLRDEMCKFVRCADGQPRASGGSNDDRIIAIALAWHGTQFVSQASGSYEALSAGEAMRKNLDPVSKRAWELRDRMILEKYGTGGVEGAGSGQKEYKTGDGDMGVFEWGDTPEEVEQAKEEAREFQEMASQVEEF